MSVNRRIFPAGCADYRENAGIVPIEHVNGCKHIVRSRIVVRKRGIKMKDAICTSRELTLATIIWSNIVRQQYLQGLSDILEIPADQRESYREMVEAAQK